MIQHVKDLHLPQDREIDVGLVGKWHSIGPVMRPSLQCSDCKHVFRDAWEKACHKCGETFPKWLGIKHPKRIECEKCKKVLQGYAKHLEHMFMKHQHIYHLIAIL